MKHTKSAFQNIYIIEFSANEYGRQMIRDLTPYIEGNMQTNDNLGQVMNFSIISLWRSMQLMCLYFGHGDNLLNG